MATHHIDDIVSSLMSDDADRQLQAAQTLAQLGADGQPAAVPLVECCESEDDELREWVVAALEELGPPNSSDVPALTRILEANCELSGYWASTLLGRLQDQAADGVEALAHAIDHSPYKSVCQRSAWALGEIGAAAESATATLQRASASSDPRLARLAKQSLVQVANVNR